MILRKKYILGKLLLLVILCSACKKKTLDNLDNITRTDVNFIEFKLDGVKHRLESNQSNTNRGAPNAMLYTIPESGAVLSYAFWSGMSLTKPDGKIDVATIFVNSPAPLMAKSYSGLTLGMMIWSLSFTFGEVYGENAYIATSISTGTVEITKIEKKVGGIVEGKFNFIDVENLDRDEKIISNGHVITDGSFRMTLKELIGNN